MSEAARSLSPAEVTVDSAPRLGALQRWLLDVVTHPASVSQGVVRAAENVASRSAHDAASLIDGGRLPAVERLAVYRNGYFARLIECLADDYPAVRDALGEEVFEALCKDFIVSHPPHSASLNHYGAPFAAYCASRRDCWCGVVADLARLEWALVGAIHADAERVLLAEALARLAPEDWQRVRLRPSPTLRVLALEYPVNRHYQARAEGAAPSLGLRRRRNLLAVCRRDTDLWRVPIAPVLGPVLSALCAGEPLPNAMALIAHAPERNGEVRGEVGARLLGQVRAALSDWVRCGFFAGVE